MNDLKSAMKSKDQAALRGIRAIKAAILLLKTDGSGQELDGENEIKLLQKLVKQRQESYAIYLKQGRNDLAQIEKEEIDIIKRYLPDELSEVQIKNIIQNIINDTGSSGMKDMGKVMSLANKEIAGRADGKIIANIAKSLLN
ncbi:MAG TPA: GatB/YqeY domain-containing protein [Saprospiraceae bacterium]|nr:GatB/YqeY domain-containing protein [Saprospiraceae bacterium]